MWIKWYRASTLCFDSDIHTTAHYSMTCGAMFLMAHIFQPLYVGELQLKAVTSVSLKDVSDDSVIRIAATHE